MSTFCFGVGYGDGYPDASRAHMPADSMLEAVYSGRVDVGQGIRSLLAQIAGEELGMASDHVRDRLGHAPHPESGSS